MPISAAQPQKPALNPPTLGGAGQTARILVADAETGRCARLARLLQPAYQVTFMGDGAAALAAVRAEPPDLLLAAVALPGLDGAGLVAALRSDLATASLPIILLASNAGAAARRAALATGAHDSLARSFTKGELLARVEAALKVAALEREAQQREAEHQAEVNRILESMGDSFVALDAEWRVTQANEAVERSTGLPRAQMLGRLVWEIFPAVLDIEAEQALLRAKAERERASFVMYYAPYQRWFEVNAYPAPGGGLAIYGRDITERKHTAAEHERLQAQADASRHLFERIAATSPDALFVVDIETGQVVYVNDRIEQLYSYTAAQVKAHGSQYALSFLHPADVAQMPLHRRRLSELADGEAYEAEMRTRFPDGTYHWVRSRYSVFSRGPEGQVQQVVGVAQDITERKHVAAALRDSEARFRGYFELGLIGMAVTSATMAWISVNDELCRMLGYTRDELLAMTWSELTHPADLTADLESFNRVLAGEIDFYTIEKRYLCRDGSVIHVSLAVKGLRRPDGSVDSFLALMQDVTERKRAEAALSETFTRLQEAHASLESMVAQRTQALTEQTALLRAEMDERARAEMARQAMLARLVSAQEEERQRVAHELHDSLGQHLVALQLGLKSVQSHAGLPPDLASALHQLRDLALRIDDAVEHLAFELRPPALDELGLETALRVLAKEWSATSGVPVAMHTQRLDEGRLPAVLETTVYRITQEALTNVLKHAGATHVSLIVERRDREVLAIVEDNGAGFRLDANSQAADLARHLGLVGMQERAAQAGGWLDIETAPGAGTTLYLHLPLVEPKAAEAMGHG